MRNAVYDPFERFMDTLVHSDTVKVILTGIGESEFTTEEIHKAIQFKIDNMESQISELKATLEIYRGFDKSRLHQLIDADMDGRLVVLPCKAGDTVWSVSWRPKEIFELIVDSIKIHEIIKHPFIVEYNVYCHDAKDGWENMWQQHQLGDSVFLTREAAEKALGGAEDGK